MDILNQLPLPQTAKVGYPWTESSVDTPQYEMTEMPKISIITPSLNQGQFIEATIRSVLLQNYPNLEYIIIDGGSIDETVELIKKYGKWITFWVSEPDNGQSDAINKGLIIATGDIFNWLNSDDLLAPNALWAIGRYFKSNTNTKALIGYLQFLNKDNQLSEPYRMKFNKEDTPKSMILSGMTQQSLFYKLESVKQIGGIDANIHFCMDLALWTCFLSAFSTKEVALSDSIFAYFRIHAQAKSQLEFKVYCERREVLLSMLKELELPNMFFQKLKFDSKLKDFNKKWSFDKAILNKNALTAYIVEHLLTIPHFDYSISYSIRLWLYSLLKKAFGRQTYFYTLPLRLVFRKIKKLL